MIKIKKNLIFFIPALTIFITGCEFDKPIDEYIKDKNELIVKLSKCKVDDNSTNCINASKAAELIKAAVAEEFKAAESCWYQISLQLTLMNQITNVDAACASNSSASPKYIIDQTTGEIKVIFTGDASDIWLTFSRKQVVSASGMGATEWTCSTALEYEQFMPEICVRKFIYQ